MMNVVTSPDVLPPQPPGPKGGVFSAALRWRYNRDPLVFLSSMARDYGDVVRLHWGGHTLYLLNHPEFIQVAFLNANQIGSDDCLGLTRCNEQTECSLFQRIDASIARIDALAENMISVFPEGQLFDLQRAWMCFSAAVVLEATFSIYSSVLVEDIVQAMYQLTLAAPSGLFSNYHNLTEIRGVRRAIAMVTKRLKDSLYSRRQNITDECSYCILLTSDVLTSALTWSSAVLAQQPEIQLALQSQVDQFSGNPLLTNTDLDDIPLSGQILLESLRWYPPVWAINREVSDEIHLVAYRLERGARVIASPWLVQRDVRFYLDAQRFSPDRWEHMSQLDRLDGAYFPFGFGQRAVLLMRLAWLAGRTALAMLARRWMAIPANGREVVPQAAFSLRAKNGLPVILSRRV